VTDVDNVSVAREFIEVCLNAAAVERLGEFVSRDVVVHAGTPCEAPDTRGIRELGDVIRRAHTVFSSFRVTVADMLADGDRVAVRWTSEGTHASEWFGIPATHKRVIFGGIDIYRFDRGKIREWWRNEDFPFLLQQLEA
jgi:predicted ester cyclase